MNKPSFYSVLTIFALLIAVLLVAISTQIPSKSPTVASPTPVVRTSLLTGNALLDGRYLFTSWASGGYEAGELICDGEGTCKLDSHMSDEGWHLGEWDTVWTVDIHGYTGSGFSQAPQCPKFCDVAYIYVNDDGSEFRMVGPSWVAEFRRTSQPQSRPSDLT